MLRRVTYTVEYQNHDPIVDGSSFTSNDLLQDETGSAVFTRIGEYQGIQETTFIVTQFELLPFVRHVMDTCSAIKNIERSWETLEYQSKY